MGENITLETLNVFQSSPQQANHWLFTAAAYNMKKNGALRSLNIPGCTNNSADKYNNFSVSTYDMVKFFEGEESARKLTGEDLQKKYCMPLECLNIYSGLGNLKIDEHKAKQAG